MKTEKFKSARTEFLGSVIAVTLEGEPITVLNRKCFITKNERSDYGVIDGETGHLIKSYSTLKSARLVESDIIKTVGEVKFNMSIKRCITNLKRFHKEIRLPLNA